MVKGITRQVILVKSPDPRLFEEAIFIVKEEALAREGVTAEQVLKEARRAADGYLKSGGPPGAGRGRVRPDKASQKQDRPTVPAAGTPGSPWTSTLRPLSYAPPGQMAPGAFPCIRSHHSDTE